MKMKIATSVGVTAALCLFVGTGCGSSDAGSKVNASGSGGASANGSGGASANGSSANGSGASASGGINANGSGATGAGANGSAGTLNLNVGSTAGDTGSAPSDSTEVCDGVDNDHDGIIDNVDKNGDGVCDCLLIATLGVKGGSGQGDVFAAWLSARSDVGAADLADQTLTPELLAKYEVIVAQDVHKNHPYTESEVAALTAWVKAGGGFMTLIGYSRSGEAHNVNQLLAPFSMSYTDQQILQKGSSSSTVPITMWTPHPIDVGVTMVGVDNGYPVQGMGTTIATGGGFDVGKVQDVEQGHVFLWGDEWITYNSEWQNHPDYQVQSLWLNAIKWLTVASRCQVDIPSNPR